MEGVKILLLNPLGEVLLHHRDDIPTIQMPNTWASIGGEVEPDESLDDALVREVREETGFILSDRSPFAVYHFRLRTCYVCVGQIDKPLSELTVGEGDDLRYFSPHEALNRRDLSPGTRMYLTDYMANLFKPISTNGNGRYD